MLLTTDTDPPDLLFSVPDLGEAIFDSLINRVDPNMRVLFHVAIRQSRNQAVVLVGAGNTFAQLQVNYDRLGTLGSAVDTDVEHGVLNSATCRQDGTNAEMAFEQIASTN